MNDNDFEAFLTNDLVPVTTNYFMNASKTIEHKLHFLGAGKNIKVLKKFKADDATSETDRLLLFKQSNEEMFKTRWIDKIEKEVKAGGQTLTGKDKKDILNTYKSITGQVNYFDSGLMQGIYDTTKLANAMAYLPLATVSSLSEAFLTLARAPVKSSVKGYQDGITKGHKIFTEELEQLLREKHKMSDDEIRREMNSVFIAVDEAMGDVTNRISGEGLQSPFLQKAARGFYRFNLLIPWTKTVQLSAFSTGKDLITDNLSKLYAIQQKSNLNIKKFSSDEFAQDAKVQRLKGELFDLGIDVEQGLQWTARGAKTNAKFYNNVVRGAGRFTNGIILPTSRESARVPTFMTNPKIDIFTQFLRYPTVFGNTILKNFARDTINDPTVNAPKVAAFVAMATNVAKATNYWRSNEEKRDKVDRKGNDWQDTLKAYQRVGLLGPLEYGLRVSEGLSYGQNPLVAGVGVGGPVINDVIGMTLYNRGLIETAARKLPLTGTKTVFDRNLGDFMEKYTGFREPYTPLQKAAKEADKLVGGTIRKGASFLVGEPESKSNVPRLLRSTGGLIPKVDPYTGQPYDEIKTHRVQYSGGGLATKIYARKVYKEGLSVERDVPDVEDDPADRSLDGTTESYKDIAGLDNTPKTPEPVRVQKNKGGNVTLPRGVRNNNRFNLAIGAVDKEKQSFIPYDNVARYNGVIGTDSKGTGIKQNEAYPIFKTQELGDRAGMHNLIKKYNNQTVDEIFSKYSATDRDTYANNVVSLTGLNRNTTLDIKNNPELAAELARGLIILENGLTEKNQTTYLRPSIESLIQAHKDSQVSKDDSEYSKTKWNTDKTNLQKTIGNLFK